MLSVLQKTLEEACVLQCLCWSSLYLVADLQDIKGRCENASHSSSKCSSYHVVLHPPLGHHSLPVVKGSSQVSRNRRHLRVHPIVSSWVEMTNDEECQLSRAVLLQFADVKFQHDATGTAAPRVSAVCSLVEISLNISGVFDTVSLSILSARGHYF